MLVPAILYKDEIQKEFMKYSYEDEMLFYTGYLGSSLPTFSENNDGENYNYAIIDNDNNLIGFLSYRINWYNSCASCFGLYSFDKNNSIIGIDTYKEIKKLINSYHLHRIEWRMIGDNPVEKHYDKLIKRYNGKKFIFTDVIKDRYGNYHDDIVYEIINKGENL